MKKITLELPLINLWKYLINNTELYMKQQTTELIVQTIYANKKWNIVEGNWVYDDKNISR